MPPHLQLYGLRYPFAMRFPLFVASAVMFFTSLTCSAQELPAIAAVRNAPGFHSAAEAQFKAYEGSLSTHCATITTDWSKATHIVYGTPRAGADRNLVNAVWVETVPGTACGQTRRFRVLVVIRSGKASMISAGSG